jgi:hypothetical protein
MIFFLRGDFMIARLSKSVSSFFILQGIISVEDREVYEYSFEILISTLLSFLAEEHDYRNKQERFNICQFTHSLIYQVLLLSRLFLHLDSRCLPPNQWLADEETL